VTYATPAFGRRRDQARERGPNAAAKQVTLDLGTARVAQPLELLGRLHALAGHRLHQLAPEAAIDEQPVPTSSNKTRRTQPTKS
jgi:hypothetical protein